MPTFWNIVVVSFVVAAALGDLCSRIIPRWFTVSGFCLGLLIQWKFGHVLDGAETALLGFAIGLGLFSIGAIGGGDVKLITALGAMMGLQPWLHAMFIAIFAAAGMALIQVVRHRVAVQTFHNMAKILYNFRTVGITAHPEINVKNPALIRSPFGVAAAIGVIAALIKI